MTLESQLFGSNCSTEVESIALFFDATANSVLPGVEKVIGTEVALGRSRTIIQATEAD